MTYDVYVPRPGYSVRPPDLKPAARQAVRDAETARLLPLNATRVRLAADPGLRGSSTPASDPPRGKRLGRRLVRALLLVLGAVAVAAVVKTFAVQAFVIPSASMVPSLEVGDRVLVEKVSYRFREPARGEIVVFSHPDTPPVRGPGPALRSFVEGLGLLRPQAGGDLIKRVVGLPGETVEIRSGAVFVDGSPLTETGIVPDRGSFPPVAVPDDGLYVLGDNRSDSDDSRYSLGTVPRSRVMGRAFLILWPPRHASASLRRHYAGVDLTDDDGRPAPATPPPAPTQPDDALEFSPP